MIARWMVLALCVSVAGRVAAQTPVPPAVPSEIVTVGTAETTLPPTRALVRVGVESHAATAAAAASQNGDRTRAIKDAVHALGLKGDSIRVSGFWVTPNYDFQHGKKLVDYQASSTIEFVVRDLERIGAAMDAALAAGATDVPTVSFESDSIEAVRHSLLAKALQAARADADPIAKAAGGHLGRLLSATTTASPRPRVTMQAGAMARVGGAPNVEGEVTVSVQVEARWEFIPGGGAPS